MTKTRVLTAKTPEQVAAAAAEGVSLLRDGGLVGFATETVYGIAAAASSGEALARLREVKSRPTGPFSVHMGAAEEVRRYVHRLPPPAARLIRRCWPGPVTLLVPTGGRLADESLQRAGLYEVLCSDGAVALRCPDEPVARVLLKGAEAPVVATSANPAAAPSPRCAEDVLAAVDGRIDLLIDSGQTRFGADSTIVRFTGDDWQLVRAGVYDRRMVRDLARQVVLFVCAGNTCRSPMAAGLAAAMLAERAGCKPSQLPSRGVDIRSAGVFAARGAPAAPEAIAAAAALGSDIADHRSRKLTPELIILADVVFCMTESQAAEARRLVPSAADRVRRLDPDGDISDPIGGDAGVYERTAKVIKAALEQLTAEGLL